MLSGLEKVRECLKFRAHNKGVFRVESKDSPLEGLQVKFFEGARPPALIYFAKNHPRNHQITWLRSQVPSSMTGDDSILAIGSPGGRRPLRPTSCRWMGVPSDRSTRKPAFEATTDRQAAMRRLPTVELRKAPSATGRLCEFASVRNRAAQFFAFEEIFIALKQSLINSPNRPEADRQESFNEGTLLGHSRQLVW